MVVWGQQDPWVPAWIPDRVAAHYGAEHVRVVRLEEAGHCPQDDAAEAVSAELLKFLHSVRDLH